MSNVYEYTRALHVFGEILRCIAYGVHGFWAEKRKEAKILRLTEYMNFTDMTV